MKLYLKGHDCKYAAEQIMMSLFNLRPQYSAEPPGEDEDWARVTLRREDGRVTAETELRYGGKLSHGRYTADAPEPGDSLASSRAEQSAVRFSFYHAAMQVLPQRPVWGALTGIRPGSLVTRMLEQGASDEEAARRMEETYFVDPRRARMCLETAHAAMDAERTLTGRDVALYIGIPFCPTRCAYCSFVSQSVEKSMGLMEPFLSALRREIDAVSKLVNRLGLRVIAVYIGGGTPTTLSDTQLADLTGHLRDAFDLSSLREFSVEAGRPDTITEPKLRALKGAATRLSVNPQSMSPEVLSAIGRSHSPQDIITATRLVRDTLDVDVNMDLIAGLPKDTAAGFADTLGKVIALSPENITVHTLALKRGSRITLEDSDRPAKDEVARMLDSGEERLRAAGYGPYYLYRQKFMSGGFENVGYSLPGHGSLYNILIMEELCTILALGGGGSTKLVDRRRGKVERIFNPKYPKEYVESIDRTLRGKERVAEFYAGTL